ncbi:MAG: SCO family protein [Aquabacterium sp.]
MSTREREAPDAALQFSVHGMPTQDLASAQRTRRGRLKMLLVWLVCAAPVVASYLTYYAWRPHTRVNHGTLVMPPRAMPPDARLPLTGPDARAVALSALKGQWLLVSVADGACPADCERHLYWQRQLREVLGKDKDRLDRVWFVTGAAPPRAALMPGLNAPGSWVLQADQQALSDWLAPDAGQALSAHLYLVDPRGDWMMRWPADADPAHIKKDLLRLMKANNSWDEAGR